MNSRLEWWCLRLDGMMGKEEAGEARGGGAGLGPSVGSSCVLLLRAPGNCQSSRGLSRFLC